MTIPPPDRWTAQERAIYEYAIELGRADARVVPPVEPVPNGKSTSEWAALTKWGPAFAALVPIVAGALERDPAVAIGLFVQILPWVAGTVGVYVVCRTAIKVAEVWKS